MIRRYTVSSVGTCRVLHTNVIHRKAIVNDNTNDDDDDDVDDDYEIGRGTISNINVNIRKMSAQP